MQSRHCKQRSDCIASRLANFVISRAIPFDVLGNLAARICLALPQQRESARKQVRSTRATSANLTIRQPLALDIARLLRPDIQAQTKPLQFGHTVIRGWCHSQPIPLGLLCKPFPWVCFAAVATHSPGSALLLLRHSPGCTLVPRAFTKQAE